MPAGKGQTQILNAIIFQTYGLNVVDEARSYVEGEHAQPPISTNSVGFDNFLFR